MTTWAGAFASWCSGVAPTGVAMQRDPATFPLQVPPSNAWCRATASYDGDLGTPNAANAACPGSGTYDDTLGDSGAGYCPDLGSWQTFTFEQAPAPKGDGALELSWITAVCGSSNLDGTLEVELQTGEAWTPILAATAGSWRGALSSR